MVADTFRAFAQNVIAPHAEHVHRTNADVPEEIVTGLAELGAFGLSVPAEYGGYSEGGDSEYIAMVAATEELSRASLGIGGSLITRPEILTRALVKGGTEEQKLEWLPKLATAEVMPAVAVTEPDFGSDVAGIKVTATRAPGPDGEDGWVINGVKTWCTFGARADALTLLARTDPDRSKTHRGLTLFIVPKPRGDSHGFELTQDPIDVDGTSRVGKMEGRPIDTIGYRGMHSYEIALEDWWVPAANQVGMEDGLGKGFYYQMAGFENGRLQTAARAVGVMQAAYEAALDYAENRKVFGEAIIDGGELGDRSNALECGIGVMIEGIEQDRMQTGCRGCADVHGDRVTDIGDTRPFELGEIRQCVIEDGGIGLGHADDVAVDDAAHLHVHARADLADLAGQDSCDLAAGVRHDAHRNAIGGERVQG
jgi:(2S)-methylsuccinyl-CoA dehydrogenase